MFKCLSPSEGGEVHKDVWAKISLINFGEKLTCLEVWSGLCVCLYVCISSSVMPALSFELKIDQAECANSMTFLPSNLMVEISPNPEVANS